MDAESTVWSKVLVSSNLSVLSRGFGLPARSFHSWNGRLKEKSVGWGGDNKIRDISSRVLQMALGEALRKEVRQDV